MRPILILSCLLLVESTVVFAQTVSTKVAGVAEPPELIGEAKKVTQPSEADKQFLDIGISDKPEHYSVERCLPAVVQRLQSEQQLSSVHEVYDCKPGWVAAKPAQYLQRKLPTACIGGLSALQ